MSHNFEDDDEFFVVRDESSKHIVTIMFNKKEDVLDFKKQFNKIKWKGDYAVDIFWPEDLEMKIK